MERGFTQKLRRVSKKLYIPKAIPPPLVMDCVLGGMLFIERNIFADD